jgi:glycosyltransferase involved in cell wall biosynthesis
VAEPLRALEIATGIGVEGVLGGAERFCIELCRALSRRAAQDVQPVMCGLWHYGTPFEDDWIRRLNAEGVRTAIGARWEPAAPYRSFLRAARRLLRLAGEARADVVHSHCPYGDLAALAAGFRPGAPAALRTAHNPREWVNRPLFRLLFTRGLYPALLRAEAGVSQEIVDGLDRRPVARLLRRRALLLPNAIDLSRFDRPRPDAARLSALRESLGLPGGAPVVGTVGRLAEQKGYAWLLRAAPLVLAESPEARFLVVGSGELAGELAALAEELGVAGRMIFAGPRSDVDALLGVMELFVSSSLWEGLPTTVLESMAAGVAVAATDIPGTRDLIRDGESGWLARPADASSLAGAIMAALRQPEERAARAARAREVARAFSIDSVAGQYADLYSRLAPRRGAREGL